MEAPSSASMPELMPSHIAHIAYVVMSKLTTRQLILTLSPGVLFRAYSYYSRTGGNDDDERPINGHTAVSRYRSELCITDLSHAGENSFSSTSWPLTPTAPRIVCFAFVSSFQGLQLLLLLT
jgi:hypothetical protein